MTNSPIQAIIINSVQNGYDPVETLLDYMEEKDSKMPRWWAENRVSVVLHELAQLTKLSSDPAGLGDHEQAS